MFDISPAPRLTAGSLRRAAACMLLAPVIQGCAVGAWKHYPELENLQVVEHVVDSGAIWTHCKGAMTPLHVALLAPPVACSTLRWDTWTCHVYVAPNTTANTREHELQHCKGWHHDDAVYRHYVAWLDGQLAWVNGTRR